MSSKVIHRISRRKHTFIHIRNVLPKGTFTTEERRVKGEWKINMSSRRLEQATEKGEWRSRLLGARGKNLSTW